MHINQKFLAWIAFKVLWVLVLPQNGPINMRRDVSDRDDTDLDSVTVRVWHLRDTWRGRTRGERTGAGDSFPMIVTHLLESSTSNDSCPRRDTLIIDLNSVFCDVWSNHSWHNNCMTYRGAFFCSCFYLHDGWKNPQDVEIG